MSVRVTPETFSFVDYDNAEITRLAEKASGDAGLPPDADIDVDVVESTPLGRVKLEEFEAGPPARAVIRVEGGAFENLKAPRKLDPVRTAETLGRMFLRLHDMLDPAFGFEGDSEALKIPRQVAWDTYAIGRLSRKGYTVSHDRWQYLWRNRHGFSDESDLVFEKLWTSDQLTWDEIRSASEGLKSDEEISAPKRVPSRPAR